jgi:hypothetical protein
MVQESTSLGTVDVAYGVVLDKGKFLAEKRKTITALFLPTKASLFAEQQKRYCG